MSTEIEKRETETPAMKPAWRRPYYTVSGNKEHYTVEVFMPGVAKDDYSVSLQHDMLVVEGRKSLPVEANAKWVHREITAESYQLRLQLNVEVDADGIAARSEEGILVIKLPVARKARPRSIKID